MKEIPQYCQVMRVTGTNGLVKEFFYPKGLDLSRPKRPRTTFTSQQLEKLELAFQKNPYLVGKERKALARDLLLTETQVKVWYQNRRTKKKIINDDTAELNISTMLNQTNIETSEDKVKSNNMLWYRALDEQQTMYSPVGFLSAFSTFNSSLTKTINTNNFLHSFSKQSSLSFNNPYWLTTTRNPLMLTPNYLPKFFSKAILSSLDSPFANYQPFTSFPSFFSSLSKEEKH